MQGFILTLAARDTPGIVHAVSGLLYQAGCNIVDSQQFGDLEGPDATGLFFMRVHFEAPQHLAAAGQLETLFEHARQQYRMDLHIHPLARRARLLLMVSQHGHCLNDLLYRWQSGQLPVDIPAVVSNHETFRSLVEGHGIPFHHLPLPKGSDAAAKQAQEQQVMAVAGACARHRVPRWRRNANPTHSSCRGVECSTRRGSRCWRGRSTR